MTNDILAQRPPPPGAPNDGRWMMIPEVLALAEQHRQARNLDQAENLCRQILQARPRHADALHLLGIIMHDAGQPTAAIDFVRKAIAVNPTMALWHSNLCEMCRLNKQLDDSVAAGRLATSLAPNYAAAHNNLGIAYFEKEKFPDAIDSYRRAIALEPNFAEAHSNLGNAYRAEKRYDEAIAAHLESLRIKPSYGDAYNNLGTVYRDQKRFTEADEYYRKALTLKPRDPAILNNLALSATQQKRLDDAMALLTSSASIDPNNHETFTFLASLWIERKDFEQAKAACDRALALKPDHAEALNVLGRITFEAGRSLDAIELYRRALELKPELSDALNNMGNALKEMGRFDEALAAYLKALDIDPKSTAVFVNFADAHKFSPDDPWLTAMEALLAEPDLLEEERTQLHYAMGKAYADVKRHEQSFRHLLAGAALKRAQIQYDERSVNDLFDRIRNTFTPELMRSRAGLGDPSQVPVLVVGMPRSGTTLVEQILASHPAVYGAGELPDLGNIVATLCGYGGAPMPFPEVVPSMGQQQLRQFGANYLAHLRQRSPDAERITDKLPANFLYAGLVTLALPNARIIHTRRNPVDTCLSCFSKLFTGEQGHTYDLAELGRYYRAYDRLMAHWREVLPESVFIEVQYEEVVGDLETQARRIISHVGLPWDDACLSFHETKRPVRTASATQVRQPIYKTSIGRWKPYQNLLMPLLNELGIDPDAA